MNQAVVKDFDANIPMKDSGVEWLGKIPTHWNLSKLKYLAIKIDELNDLDVELKIAVENIEGFSGKLINLKKFNYEGSTVKFRINDVIFNKLRPYLGKVYLAEQKGGVYGELLVLRPQEKLVPKFLYYIMISTPFINLVNSSTTGAKMPRASWEDFIKNIFIPVVPKTEQNKIVNYLDKEVSKIEILIEKKNRLISILEEKKKALIKRTLIKGLDPDVPMKDSGIEWLSKIPAHWEVNKISRVFRVIGSGTTPSSSNVEYYQDGEHNWLITSDLNDGEIIETSYRITNKALEDYSTLKLFPANSLVIAMYGATIGKTGLTKIDCYTNQACCVLGESSKVLMKFAQLFFIAIKDHLEMFSNGGGQPNISQGIIRDLKIIYPDIIEQKLIINEINNELERIDNLVNKINGSIELLKEKRRIIISTAVNGKLNVGL